VILDPRPPRARRNGRPQALSFGVVEKGAHSGQRPLTRQELRFACPPPRPDRLAIDGKAEVSLKELIRGGRIRRRSEEGDPLFGRDLKSGLAVDLRP
jgi:hypothetical protein